MFCPQCGAPDQNAEAYCRRCGDWLAERAARPDHRMKVMMSFNGLNSVMALIAAIVLYSTYLGSPEAKWSIYAAGALCLVIAVHQLISFIFALGLRVRSRRIQGARFPASAPSVENTGHLESRDTNLFVDMTSVTENTTEILEDAPGRADTKQRA